MKISFTFAIGIVLTLLVAKPCFSNEQTSLCPKESTMVFYCKGTALLHNGKETLRKYYPNVAVCDHAEGTSLALQKYDGSIELEEVKLSHKFEKAVAFSNTVMALAIGHVDANTRPGKLVYASMDADYYCFGDF